MRNLPAKTVKKRWELKRKRREVVFFKSHHFLSPRPAVMNRSATDIKKARHATVRTEPVKSRALLLCFPAPCRRENLKSTLLRLP